MEWSGTLLLVSHDRAFLDNVVTSTFAFEGNGHVNEYVGGYEDWVRQRQAPVPERASAGGEKRRPHVPDSGAAVSTVASKRLSYKEQRELDTLPARIEALEAEEQELNAHIAGPEFYKEGREAIAAALARLEAVKTQLGDAYTRWHELESRST